MAEGEETVEEMAGESMGPLSVASKGFTEQFILGHMYRLLLEAQGFEVEDKLGLGTTDIIHTAMLEGEVDLYPEYTSTGLLTVLKAEQMSDRQEIYDTVKAGYEEQFNIT
ncbi:MAG: glycine betaine ABC transporter substrate-binding protein, partial [Ardenticatenaceae bacterium]